MFTNINIEHEGARGYFVYFITQLMNRAFFSHGADPVKVMLGVFEGRRQEQKFAALVEGLSVQGDWVLMFAFLKAAQEPKGHTQRYLDGKTPSKCWKAGGKLPRVNTDWKILAGRHGGNTGEGMPHAHLSFLKAM